MITRLVHYPIFHEMPAPVLAGIYSMQAELVYTERSDVLQFDGDEQTLAVVRETQLRVLTEVRVLGAILWRETEPGEWWIQMGYVLPEERERGYYKAMWEELLVLAAQDGTVSKIIGGTAEDNEVMQKVMEKLGRKPYYRMYRFDIPEGKSKQSVRKVLSRRSK